LRIEITLFGGPLVPAAGFHRVALESPIAAIVRESESELSVRVTFNRTRADSGKFLYRKLIYMAYLDRWLFAA
jgi:hypothetical protein